MQKFSDFIGQPNFGVAHQGPLTVGAAAVTLKSLLAGADFHADTRFVEVRVETDAIRMTVDGTAPTATLGDKIPPDSCLVRLSRGEADACKVIRVTTDAKLQVKQFIN